MTKTRPTTFATLSNSLRRLGFGVVKTVGHVSFKHKTGRPVILLPTYESSQTIEPIHQMMVWKQLVDAGLIQGNTGPSKFLFDTSTVRPKRKPKGNGMLSTPKLKP